MRMPASLADTERNRKNRSARCVERNRLRGKTKGLRGLIRPVTAAYEAVDASRCKNSFFRQHSQVILRSSSTVFGEW